MIRTTAFAVSAALLAVGTHAASAQQYTVSLSGPDTVNAGDSFTVSVYASWDGVAAAGDALASFGQIVTAVSGGDYATITSVSVNTPFQGFDTTSYSASALDVNAGQLANLFGVLNPAIDMSRPIELYSFNVTVAGNAPTGTEISYDITASNSLPVISVFPDAFDGITVSSDIGDQGLTINRSLTTVVPAPGTLAIASTGLLAAARRRRRG